MRSSEPLALKRGTPNSEFSKPLTPGWSSAKLYGLRETSGRLWISRSLRLRPTSILPRSTTDASAWTETTSLTPPTSIAMLMTAEAPAVIGMPVCCCFLKPASSAVTW